MKASEVSVCSLRQNDEAPQAHSALYHKAVTTCRCGYSESERAQSAHAEEAGDPGELPAGGGGGPGASGAGRPVAGGTNRHRADPAAPEPPAALCQPVGCGEGTGLPVPGTWWVFTSHSTHTCVSCPEQLDFITVRSVLKKEGCLLIPNNILHFHACFAVCGHRSTSL